MTSGQRKTVAIVGGVCAVILGIDKCAKSDKLSIPGAASIITGLVAIFGM